MNITTRTRVEIRATQLTRSAATSSPPYGAARGARCADPTGDDIGPIVRGLRGPRTARTGGTSPSRTGRAASGGAAAACIVPPMPGPEHATPGPLRRRIGAAAVLAHGLGQRAVAKGFSLAVSGSFA